MASSTPRDTERQRVRVMQNTTQRDNHYQHGIGSISNKWCFVAGYTRRRAGERDRHGALVPDTVRASLQSFKQDQKQPSHKHMRHIHLSHITHAWNFWCKFANHNLATHMGTVKKEKDRKNTTKTGGGGYHRSSIVRQSAVDPVAIAPHTARTLTASGARSRSIALALLM